MLQLFRALCAKFTSNHSQETTEGETTYAIDNKTEEQRILQELIQLHDTLNPDGDAFNITQTIDVIAIYSKEGSKLYDLFYSLCWTMKGEAVDIKSFMKDGIDTANMAQLAYYIGDFTYQERFIGNLFGSLCSDGTVTRVVKRLKQLKTNE